jgi:SAM-dependent methyltransferase
VNNANHTTATITEVMQQLSDKVRNGQSSIVLATGAEDPLDQSPSLPPKPPTLHVTPLKEDTAERIDEVQRRAKQKTEVNRYIPKFLRGLFRKQGSFNKEILEVSRLLMKENSEADKRLREIAAYLRAENGWFDGVMSAFAQVQRTLQRRIDNQYSLEARLLVVDNKVVEAQAESRQKRQQLQEILDNVASEAKARESFEHRLEGMYAALADEAKAREGAEERLRGQHDRLDGISDILKSLQEALAGESKARESLGGRIDEITSLTGMVTEASEGVRLAKTEYDRLGRELRAAEAALGSIQDLVTRTDERQLADASYIKRQLHLHAQSLATLDTSARPTRGRKKTAAAPGSPDRMDQNHFDSFYLAFENKFRGTRAEIKQRARVYVPFLKKARVGKPESPVLDLGSGRGEWLELLRDEGLVGRGIDLNEFMVSECVERKLDVAHADAIQYLGTLDTDSQGAVTALHLIEHLPFAVLAKLFAESLRVLQPGGICIFETPNPDNLQVGSNRFYSDPTHLHPLPSAFTKFVMSITGFERLEVLPLHPDDNAVPLTDQAAPFERFAHEMFFGAQDYAVIGRK